jgi:hypothetical protein
VLVKAEDGELQEVPQALLVKQWKVKELNRQDLSSKQLLLLLLDLSKYRMVSLSPNQELLVRQHLQPMLSQSMVKQSMVKRGPAKQPVFNQPLIK